MNYNILLLLINIKLYLARDYKLACIYTNFEVGAYIHCNSLEQAKLTSEYDKCEAKSTLDLEYYRCIYKIYQIPTEQATLLGKLHMTVLKCKDCEYTHNWKFKNPKLCTNKAEAEYYKTYSDCLLNYININQEELKKRENCTRSCNRFDNFDNFDYKNFNKYYFTLRHSNCSYGCYKDIAKDIVEFEPKVTTFINISEGNKKSNTLSKFDSLSRYSAITLMILLALTIN